MSMSQNSFRMPCDKPTCRYQSVSGGTLESEFSNWQAIARIFPRLKRLRQFRAISETTAKQIVTWKVSTLPANWEELRDRWGAFHVVRIVAAIAGFVFVVGGAIF